MAKPIPKKLVQEVLDRDNGVCQICFRPGDDIHHIAVAGMGRKKVHELENLITLCRKCHNRAHSEAKMRRKCEDWSYNLYGMRIFEIKQMKWSDEVGIN